MKCPSCKEPSLVLSERQNIEIDYCPECRGIWLDRGELDKILERNKSEVDVVRARVPATAPAEYRNEQHYNYGKPYKRRKSFLEEIFD